MELEANVDCLSRHARDPHFSMARYGGGILEEYAHRRVTDKHGFEETAAPANEVPMFNLRWKNQLHSTACSHSGSAKCVCVVSSIASCSPSKTALCHWQARRATHRIAASADLALRSSLPRVEQSHCWSLDLTGCWQPWSSLVQFRAHF